MLQNEISMWIKYYAGTDLPEKEQMINDVFNYYFVSYGFDRNESKQMTVAIVVSVITDRKNKQESSNVLEFKRR